MRSTWGALAAVLVLAGCTGTAPDPADPSTSAAATALPPSTPSSRPSVHPAAGADCPLTAARLSSILGAQVSVLGSGPPEPLEEVPGARASGCTFSGDAAGSGITFRVGAGADGDKMWARLPSRCRPEGGTAAGTASVRNCVHDGALLQSLVRRRGSVVWIQFPIIDGTPPPLAARYPAVVNAVRTAR